MVNRFRWCAIFSVVTGFILPASAAGIPHYEVGDIATNTIVTPVALVVKDPVATALLQAREEHEIRTVVLYSPTIVDDVERAFRAHMALLREAFVEELTAAYGRSRIEKGLERTPKWLALTDRFRKEHTGTPKLFLYMPYWAQGRSDEHLLVDWVGRMRRVLDRPVRPDRLPEGNVGITIRLVTVPTLQTKVELDHAERYGVLTPLDNLVPLSQAVSEMRTEFPEPDRYIADFLGPFLKANCVFDLELTRLARERRVDSLIVADNYAAGQTLVRVGQVIDAKALAALDELRRQTPQAPQAPETSQDNAAAADPDRRERRDDERTLLWWMMGGGGGAFVLLIVVLWARGRTGGGRSLHRSTAVPNAASSSSRPALAAQTEEAGSELVARLEGESEREWRERALAAERKAERAKELARSNVANALKDKVVEHLSTQRDELIDRQQSAAEQMAGLEARLKRIQGPLSERLRAYEQRIAELEEELAIKDEENRALIRAKIHNLRERMAAEKAGRGPQMFDLN